MTMGFIYCVETVFIYCIQRQFCTWTIIVYSHFASFLLHVISFFSFFFFFPVVYGKDASSISLSLSLLSSLSICWEDVVGLEEQ